MAQNLDVTLKRGNGTDFDTIYPTTTWGQILSKPLTFTPTAHDHTLADITDVSAGTLAEAQAGTITENRTWTPQILKQSIEALSDLNTNNYLTGVSGSGNGTVTFTRSGLGDLTWNASHTHSIGEITGNPGDIMGSGTVFFSVCNGGGAVPYWSEGAIYSETEKSKLSGITAGTLAEAQAGTVTGNRTWTPQILKQAIEALSDLDTNNYLTGVSGSGNGTVTFTRSGLGDLTWNASHTHSYLPLSGGTITGATIISKAMSNGTTAAFTSPHLALNATDAVDSTGFVGMTFATSSSANFGWSYGAQRTTGGDGDLIWRNHNSSAQGYEKMKLSDAGDLTIAGTLTVTGTTITLPTSGTLTTSTGPLTISTSAGNGDITIAPNGSGRLIHTKQLASKGATYTHTWMQFDEDVNGNALYLGSGALTVLGSGESISQIKGQIGATTEGLVFGADDSTTATAFRFIGSLQGGWAGRTEVLSITGAGNATLLGDLAVNGGDITTSATIFSIGNTATGSQTLNLGTAATADTKVKDINIGTGGVAGSLTEIIIGSAAGGYVTIDSPDTNITGNLTVSGTLTTKNAEEVNIGDAIILLNAEETSTPSENAGIEIERGTATNSSILWNETNDRWELFNGANSTKVTIPNITGVVALVDDIPSLSKVDGTGDYMTDITVSGHAITEVKSSFSALTISTGLTGTSYKPNASTTISLTEITPSTSQSNQGALWYHGITPEAGKFDGSTTNPSGTTRLNYGGYLYATQLYDNGSRVLTAHPTVSAASSVNNSGRTYIQDITVDSFGHITGITSATETVVDTNTLNTAGSTDISTKIFLVGASTQASSAQTYSDNEIYATNGVLTTKEVQVGGTAATMKYDSTSKSIKFVFA